MQLAALAAPHHHDHRDRLRAILPGILGAVAVPPILIQIKISDHSKFNSKIFQILTSSCFDDEPGLVLLGEVASELGSLEGVRTVKNLPVSSERGSGISIGTYK